MSRRALVLLASMLIAGCAFALAFVVAASPPASAAPLVAAPKGSAPTWVAVPTFPQTTMLAGDLHCGTLPISTAPKRSAAAAYPDNGKIYVFGGRHGADGEDNTLPDIFEYTPGDPGSWVKKNAQLPHSQCVSFPTPLPNGYHPNPYSANMAAATLSNGDKDLIYLIGGSDQDGSPTNAVNVYDPDSDTVTTLTTDPWPASPARIPGGWAVFDNKIYIFGGASSRPDPLTFNDTWVFNPTDPDGTRWQQVGTANLGMARGFIAGATVDGKIYAIGGDIYSGSEPDLQLAPQTIVEVMDPSAVEPSWQPVASLPVARGDVAAYAADSGSGLLISGKIMIAGGPWGTPLANSYIYSVASNSWTAFPALLRATRNYGAAQLDGVVYAFGGYTAGTLSGSQLSQKIDVHDNTAPPTFTPTITGTATRTATVTRTATATRTVTPCAISFSDVHSGDYYYEPVRYLACAGAISGYADGTFRPFNNTTRGQLSKIIVVARGWPIDTTSGPHFRDVLQSNPFYTFIETAFHHGIISGYSDGTFRWGANVTRGQLAKIIVSAMGWATVTPPTPHFSDVPPSNTFYAFIETAFSHGIISGYGDGTFRWGADATRAQISKIVYGAVTQP